MSKTNTESKSLKFLYGNTFGRIILKILTARWISKLCGLFMDSRLSKPLISSFIKKNNIDMSEFESDNFTCFNDCFCRKIKEGKRPLSGDERTFISPCDGLLSAYKITENTILPIKQSSYTLSSLLRSDELAERFRNGICLVFRLCVNHYHRYCYPANGVKGENVFLKGKLHTVRPIALEALPVFTENCREYTVIDSEHFGSFVQMEVGAMLVGKIHNHHGKGAVLRGDEKGMFLYGGSTIVLLFEKNKINLRKEFFDSTESYEETHVLMGEKLSI